MPDGTPVLGRQGDPLPAGATRNAPIASSTQTRPSSTIIGYQNDGTPILGQPGDRLPSGASRTKPSTNTSSPRNETGLTDQGFYVIGFAADGTPILGQPGNPLPDGARATQPVASNGNADEGMFIIGFGPDGSIILGKPEDTLPFGAVQNTPAPTVSIIGYEPDGTPVVGQPGDPLPIGATAAPPAARPGQITMPFASGRDRVIGTDENGQPIYQSSSGLQYSQAEADALFREQNSLSKTNPTALGSAVKVPLSQANGAPILPDKNGFYPIVVNGQSPTGVFFEEIPYGEDPDTWVSQNQPLDRAQRMRNQNLIDAGGTTPPAYVRTNPTQGNTDNTGEFNPVGTPVTANNPNSGDKTVLSNEFTPLEGENAQVDENGNIMVGTLVPNTPEAIYGGFEAGYYVVVAAFAEKENAAEYVHQRIDEGYFAEYRFLDRGQKYYVFLFKGDDLSLARQERDRLRQLEKFKDAWIYVKE